MDIVGHSLSLFRVLFSGVCVHSLAFVVAGETISRERGLCKTLRVSILYFMYMTQMF